MLIRESQAGSAETMKFFDAILKDSMDVTQSMVTEALSSSLRNRSRVRARSVPREPAARNIVGSELERTALSAYPRSILGGGNRTAGARSTAQDQEPEPEAGRRGSPEPDREPIFDNRPAPRILTKAHPPALPDGAGVKAAPLRPPPFVVQGPRGPIDIRWVGEWDPSWADLTRMG